MSTIAVLGASGFVGSTFVQRAVLQGDLEIKAFIHSSGNAWALSRHAIPLHQVDIMSKSSLDDALQGCTHVVNCTRGSAEVMVQGLRNILESCKRQKVQRLVHLSSVAVYNGEFNGIPITEDFQGRPNKKSYGGKKFQQDKLVESACRNGLSSVVLCPPNISGAWSPFLIQLVQWMQDQDLALIEQGNAACSLIDVENLVHAIRLALDCNHADGKRIFVTDRETPSWSEIAESFKCLTTSAIPISRISVEEAQALVRVPAKKKAGLLKSIKHLVSSDVREALREDPLFGTAEAAAKGMAKKLPARILDRLMKSSNGPPKIAKLTPRFSPKPLVQQLRNARYSIDRAEELLGYTPIVTESESHEAFRAWYKTMYGINSGFADLLNVN